jgi:hypothetical protein
VHSLLGVPYGDATDTEVTWRNFLIPKEIPWLSDHRLQGRAVLPGAAYVVMACEAALLKAQAEEVRFIEVCNLAIHRAISFSDETTGAEVVLTLSDIERTRTHSGSGDEIFSANWTVQSPTNEETDKLSRIASGSVSLLLGLSEASVLPGRALDDVLPNMISVDVDEFYSTLYELGYGSHLVSGVASGKRRHCEADWENDTEEEIQRIFDRYPDDIDLKLIKSMGQAYPSIIRGESNPIEHLTKDDMLDKLYAEGLGFTVANTWAARLIKQISHRYPQMNIIDIGQFCPVSRIIIV